MYFYIIIRLLTFYNFIILYLFTQILTFIYVSEYSLFYVEDKRLTAIQSCYIIYFI